MKVADSDADGFARPSVRQRPHTGAEEQFHGVLGDGGGQAEGSPEELAEVRGGDYLGHHRWVVFLFRRFTALRGRAGIWPVDGNTWFGYRIQYGEPRIPRLPTPEKAQLHNVPIGWPCDLPIGRRWPVGPLEAGKQGAPESGRRAEGDNCRRGRKGQHDDALANQKRRFRSVERSEEHR